MSAANLIKEIPSDSVHRICAGQVVLDLATACKELVENALDAGATALEVRLRNFGADAIEVSDNGSGIARANHAALCIKHTTSKLRSFADLLGVTSFGFRGEALSSLCAVAAVTVITRVPEDATGYQLEYDHEGALKKTTPVAREPGTTVLVQSLFAPLPVRHQDFMKHLKREYGKMQSIMQAYALISVGVKIQCSNTPPNQPSSTFLLTNGNVMGGAGAEAGAGLTAQAMRQNVGAVLGVKLLQGLRPVDEADAPGGRFKLVGWVSRVDAPGRGSSDRQFLFINRRPVDFPRATRVINEAYRMCHKKHFPVAILNLQLSPNQYDVNVVPNKRQLMLHAEEDILNFLRQVMQAMYRSADAVFQAEGAQIFDQHNDDGGATAGQQPQQQQQQQKKKQAMLDSFAQFSSQASGGSSPAPVINRDNSNQKKKRRKSLDTEEENNKNSSTSPISPPPSSSTTTAAATAAAAATTPTTPTLPTSSSSAPAPSSSSRPSRPSKPLSSEEIFLMRSIVKKTTTNQEEKDKEEEESSELSVSLPPMKKQPKSSSTRRNKRKQKEEEEEEDSSTIDDSTTESSSSSSTTAATKVVTDAPMKRTTPLRSSHEETVIMRPGDEQWKLTDKPWLKKNDEKQPQQAAEQEDKEKEEEEGEPKRKKKVRFVANINEDNDAECALELQREFKMEYFNELHVIGQFNLGFIVAQLNNDLFLIDQHASDEKYNYEQLKKSTKLKTQPLIRPLTLDLSAEEEEIVQANGEVFARNGFKFVVDEAAAARSRVRLVATPFSKNVQLGVPDVHELITLLRDQPGVMCRPSRVAEMLASRACRSSIMIGTALTREQMQRVIRHMGQEMDQPFNCPHGRPTMRHLIDLNRLPQPPATEEMIKKYTM